MDLLKDNFCLIFACRKAKESDQEIDFVIDGEKYVIEAASKANMMDLEEKHADMQNKLPNHKIIMTHRPLFRLIDTLDQIESLEAAMITDGDLLDSRPTGRIAEAFNWEDKQDVVKQAGHC
ncbi:hypothetical protein PY247_10620 [Acinetobacter proteolyticus]|nr:hypothetical protein [Acinetobacter proteolyticus]WEI20126.1 hypothetical protein PY247_10620 [Acinetobacter proteolyticus]